MDKFKNIREVTSPQSGTNSPFDTHRSVVVNRNSGFNMQPTRLDFRSTNMENKFTNINMIQSQVVNNSPFSATHNSTMHGSRFGGMGGSSRVIDPMKESTMSYIRSISRGIPNISEERLKQITDNFIRLYGTDRQLTENGVKNIQRDAHENDNFEQTEATVKGLHHVLDSNKDGRISQ